MRILLPAAKAAAIAASLLLTIRLRDFRPDGALGSLPELEPNPLDWPPLLTDWKPWFWPCGRPVPDLSPPRLRTAFRRARVGWPPPCPPCAC